jgi:hypothetical protein
MSIAENAGNVIGDFSLGAGITEEDLANRDGNHRVDTGPRDDLTYLSNDDYIEKYGRIDCALDTNDRQDYWKMTIRTNDDANVGWKSVPHFVSEMALLLPRGIPSSNVSAIDKWLGSVSFYVNGNLIDTLPLEDAASRKAMLQVNGSMHGASKASKELTYNESSGKILVPLTMGGAYERLFIGCTGSSMRSTISLKVNCTWKLPDPPVLLGNLHFVRKDEPPYFRDKRPTLGILHPNMYEVDNINSSNILLPNANSVLGEKERAIPSSIQLGSDKKHALTGTNLATKAKKPATTHRCPIKNYAFHATSTTHRKTELRPRILIGDGGKEESNSVFNLVPRPVFCGRIPMIVYFWSSSPAHIVTEAKLSIRGDVYWKGSIEELDHYKARRGFSFDPHVIIVDFPDNEKFTTVDVKLEIKTIPRATFRAKKEYIPPRTKPSAHPMPRRVSLPLLGDIVTEDKEEEEEEDQENKEGSDAPSAAYLHVSSVYPITLELEDGKYVPMKDPHARSVERNRKAAEKSRARLAMDSANVGFGTAPFPEALEQKFLDPLNRMSNSDAIDRNDGQSLYSVVPHGEDADKHSAYSRMFQEFFGEEV